MTLVDNRYWKSSKKTYVWPCADDPIIDSMHNGSHCLFYNPRINKHTVTYKQSLQDLCGWINTSLDHDGIDRFLDNPLSWYDAANVLKLNMWVDSIRTQGIVKPMMLYYNGGAKFGINNGESRLRACTCIPSINRLHGFISTSTQYRDKFSHLEEVTSFDQFAWLCKADNPQEFMFTLTDPTAPYGIFWYEFNSAKTDTVTPNESNCITTLRNYLNRHPDTVFTIDWFNNLVDWKEYGLKTWIRT
jgi:hypothetical protein